MQQFTRTHQQIRQENVTANILLGLLDISDNIKTVLAARTVRIILLE